MSLMICVFALVSKSVYYSLSEEPFEEPSGAQSRDVHPHSDGECPVNERQFLNGGLQLICSLLLLVLWISKGKALLTCVVSVCSVFFSRPSSPKSDSELCKPQESLGPQMQWNWGAFPKVPCCFNYCMHTALRVQNAPKPSELPTQAVFLDIICPL